MKCQKCNENVTCHECFKNQMIKEALQLKQDLLNGAARGKPDQGQVNAYIAATFTVLELLDRNRAA